MALLQCAPELRGGHRRRQRHLRRGGARCVHKLRADGGDDNPHAGGRLDHDDERHAERRDGGAEGILDPLRNGRRSRH